MNASQVGNILGIFVASIILPIIVLIVCNFIPTAKRNPKVVYSICGVLAVAVAFISVAGGGEALSSAIAAIFAALFFFWGYKRAAKKIAAT
jgi:hypothetical protein